MKSLTELPADANITSFFGPGSGTIYGTSVACTGTEQRLTDCPVNSNSAACSHANDVGITCSIDCKSDRLLSSIKFWQFSEVHICGES